MRVNRTVWAVANNDLSARTLHQVGGLIGAVARINRHADKSARRACEQQPDVVSAIGQLESHSVPSGHTLFAEPRCQSEAVRDKARRRQADAIVEVQSGG